MLNEPDAALLDRLRALLGPHGWIDPGNGAAYLEEPRGKWHGRAALIARPADTATVAAVVRACAEARVGIVPWGGGTGLVGGQVTSEGPRPVVLALDRMAAIRRISPEDDSMTVDAGCILATVQRAADDADRLFPLSLASEGSARIGGLLSTNAGGINVLRYGSTRDLVLGIEAVLADGTVIDGLRALRKDNTGYDLRHLLIGAEGTLGIITAATLRLFPKPRETATAFCAVENPVAAGALLRSLRERLGGAISAFELIVRTGIDWQRRIMPDTPTPPVIGPWLVLTEATGGTGSGVEAAMEAGLADAFEAGLVTDAAIAQSGAQRAAFWKVREDLPEIGRRMGSITSHDVSIRLADLPAFVVQADAAVAAIDPALRVNCFGHMGDGNLHYTVFAPEGMRAADFAHLAKPVTEAVDDLVHRLGGSFSAEHGVGRLKVATLERYGDPGKLAAMRAIKAALDPVGIMNPGAVLRAPVAAAM
jgi:FAD/FMN-containing dehydrogenase